MFLRQRRRDLLVGEAAARFWWLFPPGAPRELSTELH